ncbi:MAG TPA: substrate-binding domain-containing protein [Pyrinomonadaceae bacterium]|nr:substrate-binding domain-containing protein [Pyrinomonadaceae bacterium]
MNKKVFIFFTLTAFIFFALSCGKPSTTENSTAKKLRIAVVTNNSSDWWAIAKKGGDDAAKELGDVDFDFRMLPEGTAAAQKALVDDLLARGVDGIMVSPLDVENQQEMLNNTASKTLLFTLGADAPKSNRTVYVGSDDTEAGKMAGEMVKKALPKGGKIMVFVGRSDAQNAIERLNGLKQGIQGGNIEIIDVRTDDADSAKAKTNAADTFTKFPEIDGMVGLWSYNTPAIVNAAKDAGKLGKVKIVGFDEDEQTLRAVKDGHVFATVVQQPYGFTKDAVTRMVLALRGDKSKIPADKKAIFPTQIVNQENVEKFWFELKKNRGH